MYRKDRVYNFLERCVSHIGYADIKNGFNGIGTTEISEAINIDRTNCSKELNKLVNEGKVLKIEGRPVKFFPTKKVNELFNLEVTETSIKKLSDFCSAENSINAFDKVIGNQGSLKMAIEKACAAMIYPPHGLNTILSGETGTGKTMFAEIMYKFAKSHGILSKDAPFIIFNCSEYSDNPQLLLSTLFGFKKGSFTGAENDQEGLVSKANNGILFLDEIHRLSSEGQEMLFHLIDTGKYRKLGDNDTYNSSKVLIIGATTEPLESVLLSTFLRRIPMVIDLPNISDRGMDERLELISIFFNLEFDKIQKPITIKKSVLKSLLGYQCVGNVGQLKADINLICARSYLDSISNHEERIQVTKKVLPSYILEGILNADKNREIDFLLDKLKGDLVIDGTSMPKTLISSQMWYKRLDKNASLSTIKKELEQSILEEYPSSPYNRMEHENIFKVIEPSIYYEVDIILKIAERKLQKNFSKRTYIAFAMHINSLINQPVVHSGIDINIEELKAKYSQELEVARLVKKHLEFELGIEFSPEEEYLFALFLSMDEHNSEANESKRVGLLLMAHGNGVAKNIAKVANSLLDTDHTHALDMQLEKRVDEFYLEFEDTANEVNEGSGILIMTDMGSLNSFGELYTEKTGVPTKTINFLSTPFVLEALRKTLISDYKLDEIYTEVKEIMHAYVEGNVKKSKIKKEPREVIITTCLTGQGAAITLANFLRNSISLISKYNIELFPTNSSDYRIEDFKNKRIIAVVGISDLNIAQVPFIPSEKILLDNGLSQLNEIIENYYSDSNGQQSFELTNENGLRIILEETLTFLNPQKTITTLVHSFDGMKKDLLMGENSERYLIMFVMHGASMIERVIRNECIDYPDIESLIRAKSETYAILKKGMEEIESTFMLKVPDVEIGYLMDLFDTE